MQVLAAETEFVARNKWEGLLIPIQCEPHTVHKLEEPLIFYRMTGPYPVNELRSIEFSTSSLRQDLTNHATWKDIHHYSKVRWGSLQAFVSFSFFVARFSSSFGSLFEPIGEVNLRQ
jgi:hypothetical protein